MPSATRCRTPGTRWACCCRPASSLAWWASVAGRHEGELLAEIDAQASDANPVWFAPYLSGERTPHNDARVRGGFLGLAADTTRAQMTRAVLEGVAYALADAQQALADAGTLLKRRRADRRRRPFAAVGADPGRRARRAAAPGRRERHRLRARGREARAHGSRRQHCGRPAGASAAQLRSPSCPGGAASRAPRPLAASLPDGARLRALNLHGTPRWPRPSTRPPLPAAATSA